MKKGYARILLVFYLIISFVFIGCINEGNRDDSLPKKVEISKAALDTKEYFNTNKMKIDKTWNFDNRDTMKVICKESVVGNLEPRTVKPIDNDCNTYYIKILHNDNSMEEWIFWLDKQFLRDGVAENKVNRGRYKLINKKDVIKIGNLLKN